jgi:PAS domain S-box-containing protein
MMSLRKKIILAIGLLLIVVMSGAYLVQQIVLTASFARLEEQELRAHLARVHNTLTVELAQLESITADWARWDDTYQFVEDANDAYVKSNLTDSAFENLRLNVMVFVHSSGRIVSAKGYDLHNHRAIPTPPSLTPHLTRESALLRHPDLMSGTRGILLLPEGPLLVSALPILTSENQGPSRGTLLFGRFLDEDEIARWGETIQLSLVARRWDDPALPADFRSARAALSATAPNHTRALDEQVSAGYLLLSDVYAQPALILRVTMPRDIMQQGRLSQTILATILGISGLIAFALATWGLDRLIVGRLVRLAQQVHRIGERGTSTQRVAITGNDELGTLEREINRMLEAIPASEERFRALVEHSNDLILILNRDATIRYVTPSAQTILGYTPEELGGRSALELIHPDDRATAQEAFTHRLAHPGASDLPMTLRAQHRDGSLRTIELLGSNLLDNPAVAGIVINGHDITARERAERALRESEDRYRDLVEQSHAFICTHDLQGNFLSANEWAMRLIGYENFSAASVNLREILAPETRDQVDEYLARIQRDGYAEGLMLVQTRAGEKRLWEYHNTLRTEGVAEPIVRGIAHDITEQKKLERALRESEERWRAYIEQANDFIFALDASARVTLANRALCDALGYAPEELIGKSPLEFIAPEARADAQRTLAHIFRGEQVNDFETIALTRAQRRITLEIRGRAFRQDGRIVGTLHIARDITARKDAERALAESEKRLRALIESAPIAISLSRDSKLIYANPAYVRMYGFASADELIGQPVTERLSPQCRDESLERSRLRARGESVETQYELIGLRKDGSEFPMLAMVTRVQLADGPANIGFFQDITERKRAEAALKEYSERLEQMVEARTRELRDAQEQLVRQERLAILGQVAGSIAHELRSPLGAIKNAVYYFKLCIENPSPEVREMMQILDQQVDVSARIIGSLLDFARPKPPTLQRVKIPHVIRAALDQCELPANVALEWQLAPDLPSAMLDAAQMQVVFRNLIANALQAMPEGGRLTISARTISDFRFKISDLPTTPHGVETRDHKSEILKQQSAIEIRISDTGVGIPPDALDKIFQPLYTTKAKGIGLGLAMCKTIIEAHGGAIAAESTVGKGATFIVRLPVGQ